MSVARSPEYSRPESGFPAAMLIPLAGDDQVVVAEKKPPEKAEQAMPDAALDNVFVSDETKISRGVKPGEKVLRGLLNDIVSGVLLAFVLTPLPVFTTCVVLALLGFMVVEIRNRRRARREKRHLWRLCREAARLYEQGLSGLSIMPGQVDHTAKCGLVGRGTDLLDSHAAVGNDMRKVERDMKKMPRRHALKKIEGLIVRLKRQKDSFHSFQREVLRRVCAQAFALRDLPVVPVDEQDYTAAFIILRHDIPPALWPALDKILSASVTLQARTSDKKHVNVPGTFERGSRLVFGRQYLEDADELRLTVRHIVGEKTVIDFNVQHEPLPQATRHVETRGAMPRRAPPCRHPSGHRI